MKARHAILALAAIAAAVTLTSVAAAGPAATKQRMQIDTKFPGDTFALTALEVGAIKGDTGKQRCDSEPTKTTVYRDGQETYPWSCGAWTFVGKRGTLVLRSQYVWIEAGGPYNVATGTWKVVRGTGQYARVTGGGRSARVGTASIERVRYQGYLTSP
jgi:hypothetical protein